MPVSVENSRNVKNLIFNKGRMAMKMNIDRPIIDSNHNTQIQVWFENRTTNNVVNSNVRLTQTLTAKAGDLDLDTKK